MDDNCIYCGGEYRNSVMYQEMGSDDTKGHAIEWNYCPVCDPPPPPIHGIQRPETKHDRRTLRESFPIARCL